MDEFEFYDGLPTTGNTASILNGVIKEIEDDYFLLPYSINNPLSPIARQKMQKKSCFRKI